MNGSPAPAEAATRDRLIAHCCVGIRGELTNLALYSENDRTFYVRATTKHGNGRIRPDHTVNNEEQAVRWHVDLIMLYYETKRRLERLDLASIA